MARRLIRAFINKTASFLNVCQEGRVHHQLLSGVGSGCIIEHQGQEDEHIPALHIDDHDRPVLTARQMASGSSCWQR